jgi:hypothetical protein
VDALSGEDDPPHSAAALEILELMTDLHIARGELRIAQAQHDLLTTRSCLSLARRSLELGRMDNAQAHLAQAASYLNAVRPLALDMNPARLDRINSELLVADLRSEDSPMAPTGS